MNDRPEATMSECLDNKTDVNGISGDCAIIRKGDDGEDIDSNNSATASISSSSSVSLTSSDETNAASSSMSVSSDSIKSENLWWIHGNGYDLMDFVENHPGGVEAILLGKGRDCTALVESYHAFSGDRVWKTLEKYRSPAKLPEDEDEGDADGRSGRVHDFFYEVLKERAIKVLRSKGIDPVKDRGASKTRIAYYIVVFVAWIYTGYLHCSASLWGSFGFAVTGWLMGALGHDAGHFAASRRAIVNEYGVWAMSFICNPVMWQQQHTYGHHSFTNEFDRDPDLHHFELLLRVHKKFKYESRFQYQSSFLYVLFAYIFVVFGTCFWIPWGVLSEGTLYGIIEWHDKDRPTKFYGMILHLVCYVGIVLLIPMYTHESFGKAALASYIHVATLGITFALFSQINHLNEPSLEADMDNRQQRYDEKKAIGRDPRLATSWGAAQVETANNFASNSLFWHVLSNGLNHQIEHHLFPGLNHGHLHHIAPVVRETCEEFGVEYKCYDTWSDLMNATMEWFDKLSVTDNNSIDNDAATPGFKTIKIS
mmetsp:Transcript_13804/g.34678  ORF Transcript_13804/g.34678 Transcript_13804/m.34678 type:complete len:538 (+) Transcript_13804:109-1722(+)|eukprot:CAMPEP_0116089184 /NCGR_PEP_ID=MMETSP0327-20121206/6294_1 /TAXON_ID=44447 /ORGANISM="Pseudo-nitzschia delicatissima, Strain B596" /LENGTH=537 /DNA_ID=CAMNT_0003580367 /DNA_START=102 /DNA_END=1715 /DNA_ORIENTATION=-